MTKITSKLKTTLNLLIIMLSLFEQFIVNWAQNDRKVLFYCSYACLSFELVLLLIFKNLICDNKRVICLQFYYFANPLFILKVSKTVHPKAAHFFKSSHIDLFLYITQGTGKKAHIGINRECVSQPWMFSNFRHSHTFKRIGLEYSVDKIFGERRDVIRDSIFCF
jgi:hypothetical protein